MYDLIALNQLRKMVENATSLSRTDLTKTMGDPRRDINQECGYPAIGELTAQAYKDLYDSENIAARVVYVLPTESWQSQPTVFEKKNAEEKTAFEKAWDNLSRELRGDSFFQDEEGSPVWEALARVDILSGIGSFGVLLIGVDDGKSLNEPAEMRQELGRRSPMGGLIGTDAQYYQGLGNEEDPGLPMREEEEEPTEEEPLAEGEDGEGPPDNSVALGLDGEEEEGEGGEFDGEMTLENLPNLDLLGIDTRTQQFEVGFGKDKTKRKLIYLRAFDETLVQITQFDSDETSPRYGLPVMYQITFNDPKENHGGTGIGTATRLVHWTRVLHVADNLNSSEVFGVPRMRPVYHRLLDLQKLYGGSAEMYWRGAFPGLSFETHPQLGGDVTMDLTAIRDAAERYMNTLQRYLATEGMTVKSIAPTVVDPATQIDTQITGVCIVVAIPKRVFMGSERGELSSGQDDTTWNGRLKARQRQYLTPRIIVPFVDRLIQLYVLPKPIGYSVEWPDLDTLQPIQQAQVAAALTGAITAYVSSGADALIAPTDFFVHILGFDEALVESILENVMEHMTEANPDMAPEELIPGQDPNPPAPMMMDEEGNIIGGDEEEEEDPSTEVDQPKVPEFSQNSRGMTILDALTVQNTKVGDLPPLYYMVKNGRLVKIYNALSTNAFDESDRKRAPAGSSRGGEFTSGSAGGLPPTNKQPSAKAKKGKSDAHELTIKIKETGPKEGTFTGWGGSSAVRAGESQGIERPSSDDSVERKKALKKKVQSIAESISKAKVRLPGKKKREELTAVVERVLDSSVKDFYRGRKRGNKKDTRVTAWGVQGSHKKPFRLSFKSEESLRRWGDNNKAVIEGIDRPKNETPKGHIKEAIHRTAKNLVDITGSVAKSGSKEALRIGVSLAVDALLRKITGNMGPVLNASASEYDVTDPYILAIASTLYTEGYHQLVANFNPNHLGKGSDKGGEFAPGKGGSSSATAGKNGKPKVGKKPKPKWYGDPNQEPDDYEGGDWGKLSTKDRTDYLKGYNFDKDPKLGKGKPKQGGINKSSIGGAALGAAGVLAGDSLGTAIGAAVGGGIGGLFGGAGAAPGAAIGGFVGSWAGAVGGGELAHAAAEKIGGEEAAKGAQVGRVIGGIASWARFAKSKFKGGKPPKPGKETGDYWKSLSEGADKLPKKKPPTENEEEPVYDPDEEIRQMDEEDTEQPEQPGMEAEEEGMVETPEEGLEEESDGLGYPDLDDDLAGLIGEEEEEESPVIVYPWEQAFQRLEVAHEVAKKLRMMGSPNIHFPLTCWRGISEKTAASVIGEDIVTFNGELISSLDPDKAIEPGITILLEIYAIEGQYIPNNDGLYISQTEPSFRVIGEVTNGQMQIIYLEQVDPLELQRDAAEEQEALEEAQEDLLSQVPTEDQDPGMLPEGEEPMDEALGEEGIMEEEEESADPWMEEEDA